MFDWLGFSSIIEPACHEEDRDACHLCRQSPHTSYFPSLLLQAFVSHYFNLMINNLSSARLNRVGLQERAQSPSVNGCMGKQENGVTYATLCGIQNERVSEI